MCGVSPVDRAKWPPAIRALLGAKCDDVYGDRKQEIVFIGPSADWFGWSSACLCFAAVCGEIVGQSDGGILVVDPGDTVWWVYRRDKDERPAC